MSKWTKIGRDENKNSKKTVKETWTLQFELRVGSSEKQKKL